MHEYPGLGLGVRHHDQDQYGFYPIGAHGNCYGSESNIITVRELAMMDIMEKITDKENWHKKVFDDGIVAKWRKEALAIPDDALRKLATHGKHQSWSNEGAVQLRDSHFHDDFDLEGIMNEETFEVCVQELRSKARYLEKTGIIPTLDASASVAKSDSLVSKDLQEALRTAFDKLKADQKAAPDWHPNTNDMVQDIVHPSMYPLVYGRSRVFQEECVGVTNAVEQWAGKGDIIHQEDAPDRGNGYGYGVGGGTVPPEYWSTTYQWLPANMAFQADGSLKFTSYINNLHPNRFPDIYRTVERLVETSLPIWDQCLALATGHEEKDGAGRTEPRTPYPENADDLNADNWIPNDPAACANVEVTKEELAAVGYEDEDDESDLPYPGPRPPEDKQFKMEELNEHKWRVVRKPVIPKVEFEDIDYAPEADGRLIDRYRESGLQVIVKMASIELTPEKPEFPTGGWHIEGQMNEHICGTALYYLDSENITESSLSFRMQTSAYLSDDDPFTVSQQGYYWLEQVYGTELGGGSAPCLQNYGTVQTRPGRLLAFPNVFQHRVSPFKLADPTKPGYRRFIALWLVDPTIRIISTANVPPQQMTWYVDSLLGETSSKRNEALSKLPPDLVNLLAEKGLSGVQANENGRLPEELMDMVREYFNANKEGLPISVDEANVHRMKLMAERSAFKKTAEGGWQQHSYSFCEH